MIEEARTIAAVATAPGRGGVAVIRVSGPEAFEIAERLTGQKPEIGRVRFARFFDCSQSPAKAVDGNGEGTGPKAIDEGVVLAFRAPHSYTGEDVVELHCHGGTVSPRRVLEACFAAGARLARRGEFTQRAFLNGRVDYDQAESVLDLIDAKTARAADAAIAGLSGCRVRECRELYETALGISVDLEHALDISEDELPADFEPSIRARIGNLVARLQRAIRTAHEGKILREGALVVLAGPPNSGKSSLMNVLLEENRAIVSEMPGTTRDSIEEWMDLDGWPIRLVDTAGLRVAADAVEAEGVRRSEDLIARADIVVELAESAARKLESPALRGPGADISVIPVTSKCDLGRGPGLNVSAKTGEGLSKLKRTICARLESLAGSTGTDPMGGSTGTDPMGESTLQEALAALEGLQAKVSGPDTDYQVAGAEEGTLDLVLAGNAARTASERLGRQIGAVYSADLLDNLFSRFCIGK